MNYINKIFSLEEMSSAQVAFNLCQDNGFKEIALLLEKPTYGIFVKQMTQRNNPDNQFEIFVCNPEKLSIWANMKKDNWSLDALARSCCFSDKEKVRLWDAAIKEQCQRLVEGIPSILRPGVHVWINRIALEYLSYSRRIEVLFGVSRYFLMSVLTCEDWTKAGRLDEKKLALRLIQDERLTVLQRYRIACAYCLHVQIYQLWMRLTQEDKQFTSFKYGDGLSKETNDLVLLWSRHMYREQEERIAEFQTNHPWTYAVRKATFYGNHTGVMLCWERLKEHIPQLIIFDMALLSLQKWQSVPKLQAYSSYKEILVSNRLRIDPRAFENFNLPFYYSELMFFFLSQMDEEHQLTFFKEAFQSGYTDRIIECFLDWPHHDDFLPTISRLWGIIPKDKYGQCLLTLVKMYCGNDEKENCYYDYQSLLRMLWKITPEEYKQYVFIDYESTDSLRVNIGRELLSRLSEKYPFQEKDESLFKCFFHDQPQEGRRVIMCSEVGEYICLQLIQKEKWSFVNCLLEACLPKEEIPSFKKEFIHSNSGFNFCVEEFKQNREWLVEGVINWALDVESEKEQFKCALISGLDDSNTWENLLCTGEFSKVDRIINFLSSSDQKKKLYQWNFASYACRILVEKRALEHIDAILRWFLDDEEEIRDLKRHILEYRGMCPF